MEELASALAYFFFLFQLPVFPVLIGVAFVPHPVFAVLHVLASLVLPLPFLMMALFPEVTLMIRTESHRGQDLSLLLPSGCFFIGQCSLFGHDPVIFFFPMPASLLLRPWQPICQLCFEPLHLPSSLLQQLLYHSRCASFLLLFLFT